MKRKRVAFVVLVVVTCIVVLSGCPSLVNDTDDSNNGDIATGSVAEPTFSLQSGTYPSSISPVASCTTSGAEIRFSIVSEAGPFSVCPGTLSISECTTVWAYAAAEGRADSELVRVDYAIVPGAATNLVGNGDFALGQALWGSYVGESEGAAAEFAYSGGSARISIDQPADEYWRIQLDYCPPFLLEAGRIYTVSFDASATQERRILVNLGELNRDLDGNGEAWDPYLQATVNLTSQTQTFSREYVMREPDDDRPEFSFFLGKEAGDVMIDNVSLTVRDPVVITSAQIPDAALRAAIADELTISEGALTDADLLSIEELEAEERGITDLNGIELCKNLERLEIEGNALNSLQPLASHPTLKDINLANCGLASADDLAPLATIPNLERVKIDDNPLDLAALQATFDPISTQPIRRIEVSNHFDLIDNIEALFDYLISFPAVTDLKITGFESYDDDAFSYLYESLVDEGRLQQIEYLYLGWNTLTDQSLSLIAQMSGVRSLTLAHNQITDISALETMTDIEKLELSGNGPFDLQPLRRIMENGGFALEDDPLVGINDNNLDLAPGTDNRAVVDYLIDGGVTVEWEEGNIIN